MPERYAARPGRAHRSAGVVQTFEHLYDRGMTSTAAVVTGDVDALWDEAAIVAGRLNRAHAQLVDLTVQLIEGERWGEGGFRSPEHWLVVRAGLAPARAADVVRIAQRRRKLPAMVSALAAGELSVDQAAVLARHGRPDHQAGMAEFARGATVPQLRRALGRSVFQEPEAAEAAPAIAAGSTTPLEAMRAEQEHQADAKASARADLAMYYDELGRFHLRYSAPAELGALVEQAVREAKDALFTSRRAEEVTTSVPAASSPGSTFGRDAGRVSYADALAEIASRSLGSVKATGRASHYRVYVHLSTDGAWVGGGGAIPPSLASKFACDGIVQPVWETDGRPVSVGRDQRIVPARTRRLIEDRDRGCRFPGCTTSGFLEIHHLDHWAAGGDPDYDRQICLCPAHHDDHHRGEFTIAGDPTRPDGLAFTAPHGRAIGPPTPPELAARPRQGGGTTDDDPPGARPYASPSGGPMYARDVGWAPDTERSHLHLVPHVQPSVEPGAVPHPLSPGHPHHGR